ncbi:MAG: amino acid adenylation domain-containing protein [Gammaproteobacteria bacterium]|nr:amino acid adenylation domain-containing protein [Gammaproteobacteria bacterium]
MNDQFRVCAGSHDNITIGATFAQRFAERAVQQAEHDAATFEGQTLTYGELNALSDRLAAQLVARGIGRGSLVGIYIERSLNMLVALLGTMKAGAAYVPLDPAFPADRIAYMLDDCAAQMVLTQQSLINTLPPFAGETLALDSDWHTGADGDRVSVEQAPTPDDLAYVIYTSGSTGRPKGVEIQHRALMNFLCSMQQQPGLTDRDRLLAVTTLSFDIAGLELYLPLLVGARVFIASRTTASDGNLLAHSINDNSITVMQATPASWRLLLDAEWQGATGLRIFCGGEALPRELADRLLPMCDELWNLYGPTETTIWSTVGRVTQGNGAPSIGFPIANTDLLLLNDKLETVADGEAGELFIGGEGLARGYFKRPELTAERFVDLAPDAQTKQRFYRTGDLARRLADGSLEHLGRVDFQVKVRGFRIELGEIEAVLDRLPEIRQSAVLAREDSPGDKRLVAYFIPAAAATLTPKDLRRELAKTLPDYMVPALYVAMDSFPLTPNGKVDRKQFPAPESGRLELADEYVEPVGDDQKRLAKIWSDVLRVERVGSNDNFFELGGDSLKVAQVATRIRDEFKVDILLRLLFENPTVASLAKAIATAEDAVETDVDLPFRVVDRSGYIPLTFAQERVWFLHQLNPRNLAYNFISTITFTGALDRAALEKTLGEVLRRHESYRTSFPTVDGGPVQVIHPAPDYHLPFIDLGDKSEQAQEQAFAEWSKGEYAHRFDLSKLPLVRWTLFRYSDDKHVLVHMEHHLVHDGWAFNLFIRELVPLYNAFAAGQSSPLADPPIQLAEFATWQHEWMQGDVSDRQLAYWRKQFQTIPPVLDLPTRGPRPAEQTFRGTSLRPEIDLDVCNGLRALGRREGSTLFMTMLAAFFALLHRYTGENDVAIGTFFANRRKSESESVIGMILNNVVIRAALDRNPTMRELIHQVRSVVLEGANHQDVPFDRVVESVQPKRDMSMNPLFQVMFSFHDEPMPEQGMTGLDVRLKPVISNGSSKFDLGVIGIPHSAQHLGLPQGSEQDGLTMIWEHNTDLFDTAVIARMIEHYKAVLRAVVDNPDQHVSDIVLSSADEQHKTLVDWNRTSADYRRDMPLHALVSAQCAQTPDATAVVTASGTLSYAELETGSNRLANFLRRRGVQANTLVGLCVDRSPNMLIGLLGILKTGAAYVPIDPKFPLDRQLFILEDAAISTLLTEGDLAQQLQQDGIDVVNLDDDRAAIDSESPNLDNPVDVPADALAYVIFTSGSTGRPKGVQIPHRAIVNFLESMRKKPGMSSDDRLLAVTTLSFDIAGLELYLPLIVGGQVIVASRDTAINGEALAAQIAHSGATIMQATPTTWQMLLDSGWQGSPHLTALCGGEAFPRALAEELLPRVGKVWNMYGPTETTVWSTVYEVRSGQGPVPIGQPIDNTQIYLLDTYGNPVPPGLVGELCIAGDGLAVGYLKRPELTQEKFCVMDLPGLPGTRLYRTGDLARYHDNGTLECLGRTDHQIKVRGFRIETGEIEAVIDQIPAVSQSVVVAREDVPGDKRLVAYVAPLDGQTLSTGELADELKNYLPEYMIPSAIVILDSLPLTPNGKVDRKALPAPTMQIAHEQSDYRAPRNDLEQRLVQIWERLIGASPIGIEDDFFAVGGHSLLAVRLISEIEKELGKRLSLAALLQGRTIASVAAALGGEGGASGSGFLKLRECGDKIPFIAAGSHPRYADLYTLLGEDRPFYQLDLYGLLSERSQHGLRPFTTIEEFAAHYVDEILKARPHGPYDIGGGCEGAYVAFEIALRLQALGHEVNSLIMWIPPALRESKGNSLKRFPAFLALERVRNLIAGGALKPGNGHPLKLLAKHELLEYRINQALCSYVPKGRFDGDITLIRTKYSPFNYGADLNKPWLDRTTMGGEVHVVSGDHGNWLYDHMDEFVGVLRERLERPAPSQVRKAS